MKIVVLMIGMMCAGCTVIKYSTVDMTQAGVINRAGFGGMGTNTVENTTTGGLEAEL